MKSYKKIQSSDEQRDTTFGYIFGRMVMSLDEWFCRWMNSYIFG